MTTRQDLTEPQIREAVRRNWKYFEAMHWDRLSSAVKYYVKNPDAFDDDCHALQVAREAEIKERTPKDEAEVVRKTAEAIGQIRDYAHRGYPADEIETQCVLDWIDGSGWAPSCIEAVINGTNQARITRFLAGIARERRW